MNKLKNNKMHKRSSLKEELNNGGEETREIGVGACRTDVVVHIIKKRWLLVKQDYTNKTSNDLRPIKIYNLKK